MPDLTVVGTAWRGVAWASVPVLRLRSAAVTGFFGGTPGSGPQAQTATFLDQTITVTFAVALNGTKNMPWEFKPVAPR